MSVDSLVPLPNEMYQLEIFPRLFLEITAKPAEDAEIYIYSCRNSYVCTDRKLAKTNFFKNEIRSEENLDEKETIELAKLINSISLTCKFFYECTQPYREKIQQAKEQFDKIKNFVGEIRPGSCKTNARNNLSESNFYEIPMRDFTPTTPCLDRIAQIMNQTIEQRNPEIVIFGYNNSEGLVKALDFVNSLDSNISENLQVENPHAEPMLLNTMLNAIYSDDDE